MNRFLVGATTLALATFLQAAPQQATGGQPPAQSGKQQTHKSSGKHKGKHSGEKSTQHSKHSKPSGADGTAQ